MNGFKLNSLTATGKIVSPVTVNFKNGLNLIIGPSDTGKTYIFESIDYLLGGSNPPKQINESKNYLTMYLEIENYSSNSVCTISRSLVNPTDDIIIYHSDIFGIDSAESTALHYESHKTKKNISTFLLEICNFQPPISTRVNTNYKKENFSFRSYIPYSMVSETKMIAENSPIYHNTSYQDRTKYLYQFKFLVTNSDDSDVEEAIGKKCSMQLKTLT